MIEFDLVLALVYAHHDPFYMLEWLADESLDHRFTLFSGLLERHKRGRVFDCEGLAKGLWETATHLRIGIRSAKNAPGTVAFPIISIVSSASVIY